MMMVMEKWWWKWWWVKSFPGKCLFSRKVPLIICWSTPLWMICGLLYEFLLIIHAFVHTNHDSVPLTYTSNLLGSPPLRIIWTVHLTSWVALNLRFHFFHYCVMEYLAFRMEIWNFNQKRLWDFGAHKIVWSDFHQKSHNEILRGKYF
jgi:hypothetical protein